MQIKKTKQTKDYRGVKQAADKKAPNIYKNLVAAKPREHVDPSARDKSIIGTCNR